MNSSVIFILFVNDKKISKEFYEKIENRDIQTNFGTFKDGLRQMQLAEKIYESAIERKWVHVD